MRVQRTVEETKICKQHFLITRRVYKNLNLNLKFILILRRCWIYSTVDKYKVKLFLAISVLSVDVKMAYLFVNIRFTTVVFR